MTMATAAYKQGTIPGGSWTALRLRRSKGWTLGEAWRDEYKEPVGGGSAHVHFHFQHTIGHSS